MARMNGINFVYIFVGALIGLMFVGSIETLASDAVSNSSGIAATIYGYVPAMYALCCLGLLVGSLYLFFKSR